VNHVLFCFLGLFIACQFMDLGIAIPTPQSDTDWTNVTNFVKDTLSLLDIGGNSNTIRVAVVTYRGQSFVFRGTAANHSVLTLLVEC
jgi:hypothetical protein